MNQIRMRTNLSFSFPTVSVDFTILSIDSTLLSINVPLSHKKNSLLVKTSNQLDNLIKSEFRVIYLLCDLTQINHSFCVNIGILKQRKPYLSSIITAPKTVPIRFSCSHRCLILSLFSLFIFHKDLTF